MRDYFSLLRQSALVVPANRARLDRALAIYHEHDDKLWSLTDCLSLVVMRERGLTVALTGDRHFAQAGFKAIFA